MKLPSIKGREIIPVRLISFVTGFMVNPIEVARTLAHEQGLGCPAFLKEDELFSHHLDIEGPSERMLPKEWDRVVSDLEVLGTKTHQQEQFKREKYSEWRHEATKVLPSGVFVWKDELETVFNAVFKDEVRGCLAGERAGSRELNFNPYVEPQFLSLVWEGFEHLFPASQPTKEQTDHAGRETEGRNADEILTINESDKELSSATEITKEESSKRVSRRADLLSEEIDAAIKELGGYMTPKRVMGKLKEYAGNEGSCIVRKTSEGIIWRDQLGAEKEFDLEALRKRLGRKNRTIREG